MAVFTHVETIDPSEYETRFYPLDPDEVGAHARELQALVDGARKLVTVDPAWALWALECAVDAEFLHDQDDVLNGARVFMEAAFDQLYLAERRTGPTDYDVVS